MLDWMPGAERVKGAQPGLTGMLGGPCKVTHHITTGGGFDFLTGYLVQRGFEPTLIVDPVSGRIAQFLPATRGGYALQHTTAPTNTQGACNIQIEWCWNTMSDLTIDKAPKWDEVWGRVLEFARANNVPDRIPFGSINTLTDRDPAKWIQGGHACHFNAPGNTHVDGLPVSSESVMFAAPLPVPAPVPAQKAAPDMILCSDFAGTTVYLLAPDKTRRKIADPATKAMLVKAGVPDVGRLASNVLGEWSLV